MKGAVVFAVVALAGCVGAGQGESSRSSPEPGGSSVSVASPVSVSPSPSVSLPSAVPSSVQALSAQQQAAQDVVREYVETLDVLLTDPQADVQPLVDLFANAELASAEVRMIHNYRVKGITKVGEVRYHYGSVGDLVEAGGEVSVEVNLCTDARESDLIDSAGNSVLKDRTGFVNTTFDIIQNGSFWRINSKFGKEVTSC